MVLALFEFLGVLFAVVSIITFFIGQSQGRKENEALHTKIDKMKEEIRYEISDDTIDALNAQNRVREGGKVVKRNNKPAADITRGISDIVNISEDVQVVKNSGRSMTEKIEVGDEIGVKVVKAKKPFDIKTQNIKTFSTDVLVVDSKDKEIGKPTSQNDSSSQDKTQQDSES